MFGPSSWLWLVIAVAALTLATAMAIAFFGMARDVRTLREEVTRLRQASERDRASLS